MNQTRIIMLVSKSNPLAKKKLVQLSDLEEFPYLSYDQGTHNSFYFSEEILSQEHHKKISAKDEFESLLRNAGITKYDEKFYWST